MSTEVRRRSRSRGGVTSGSGKPILLATFGVPFDEAAVAVALDAAVESGGPLIVANVTRLEPLALSVMMGYDALEELTPEVSASVGRPARMAAGFGLHVERLRIRTPRPVAALLELVREREPGLLVFGPDRGRLSRRRYRKASAILRSRVGCLVWLPEGAKA
jgi:nucleotide-binding universal stress UspA family protein